MFAFVLFTFRIDISTIYHSDFARDLYEILKIAQGNLTLLGPKLTFGGLYNAPYYFYLFVPVFLLSGFSILSINFFNAFLFACAIGYFSKKALEKYSLWKGIAAAICISTINLYIFASRSPSNANTYIAFLLILLTYIQFESINGKWKLLFIGFMYGVIMNFDLAAAILFPSLLILIVYKIQDKKTALLFVLGTIISFLPLVLFEIKHSFILIRNTFIEKSYLAWIDSKNISGGATGKKNILENIFFMSHEMKPFLSINPLIGYIAFIAIYFFEKRSRSRLFLLLNGFFSLFILSALIRFQFASHYIFPTAFFLFFTLIILLLESRFSIFLVFIIIMSVVYFPTHLYKQSDITARPFEKAVKFSIEKHLVEKNTRFNIVHIAHPNGIIGFEYRYFFQKYGYIPLSEFEYDKSDILLIFTERKNFHPSQLNSWEIEQFGRKYINRTEEFTVGSIHIYKAKKT